jgi:hypothetical protein
MTLFPPATTFGSRAITFEPHAVIFSHTHGQYPHVQCIGDKLQCNEPSLQYELIAMLFILIISQAELVDAQLRLGCLLYISSMVQQRSAHRTCDYRRLPRQIDELHQL